MTFARREQRGELDQLSRRKADELERWLAAAPVLTAELPAVARTYRASLSDLAALRMHPDLARNATLPAAGLPWFMAMFGRDTLITSFQALPYLPGLAATTLRVLADRQAADRDDFHEREPGKILHELRFGELTARGERPYSPYYGTADATPLFLVLLDEYHRWSGDDELVRALEPNARAALDWIADSGDSDGDGYVEYLCRTHQPASPTSAGRTAGTRSSTPTERWRPGRSPPARSRATSMTRSAAAPASPARCGGIPRSPGGSTPCPALRDSFQRDFWIPERGHHALALDGEKRQVDSLARTSASCCGPGCWAGRGRRDRLASARRGRSIGGWGVRTLGAGRRLQPARLPHGDRLAPRQLVDRRRTGSLRPSRGGEDDRRRDSRRRAPLRIPPARGLRRLPALR